MYSVSQYFFLLLYRNVIVDWSKWECENDMCCIVSTNKNVLNIIVEYIFISGSTHQQRLQFFKRILSLLITPGNVKRSMYSVKHHLMND